MSGKEAVDRSSTDDNFNFKLNPWTTRPRAKTREGTIGALDKSKYKYSSILTASH